MSGPRAAGPTQPLTAGVWFKNPELNAYQLVASDIVTFHNYNNAESLSAQIGEFEEAGPPGGSAPSGCVAATARWPRACRLFQREKVGCCNWGLVSGKTQTIYAWGTKQGAPEPARWFHDLLRQDGTPFDPKEAALFKQLTGRP